MHVGTDSINFSACVYELLMINVRLYTFHAVCHGVRDQQCGFVAMLKRFKVVNLMLLRG